MEHDVAHLAQDQVLQDLFSLFYHISCQICTVVDTISYFVVVVGARSPAESKSCGEKFSLDL